MLGGKPAALLVPRWPRGFTKRLTIHLTLCLGPAVKFAQVYAVVNELASELGHSDAGQAADDQHC